MHMRECLWAQRGERALACEQRFAWRKSYAEGIALQLRQLWRQSKVQDAHEHYQESRSDEHFEQRIALQAHRQDDVFARQCLELCFPETHGRSRARVKVVPPRETVPLPRG